MTNEEVKIRTGIDNTAIAGGLRDLNAQIKSGVSQTNASIKGIGKQFQDYGKFLKGFGVFGFINQVTAIISPYTNALAAYFGKVSAHGQEAETKLRALAKYFDPYIKKIREARKEQDKLREEAKKLDSQIAEQSRDNQFDAASKQERVNILQEEQADLIRKIQNGGLDIVDKKKAELELLKKQKDYADALNDLSKERADKEKEAAKEDEEHLKEAIRLNKELAKNEKEQAQTQKEIARQKQADFESKLKDYIPSIENVAKSNSIFAGEAQDVLRAKQIAAQDMLNFGADKQTLSEIDYANKLESNFKKHFGLSAQEKTAEAVQKSEEHLAELVEQNAELVAEIKGE